MICSVADMDKNCGHGVGASVCKHCEGLEDLRRDLEETRRANFTYQAAFKELEEWRSGKRRVFWRVRWTHPQKGLREKDYVSMGKAISKVTCGEGVLSGKVMRVSVRPKGEI